MIREVVGKKLGMTHIFDEEANLVAITIVEIGSMCVLEKVFYPKGIKVKVGYFKVSPSKTKRIKKPLKGYFTKLGVPFYEVIKEVDIEDEKNLKVKEEFGIEVLKEGEIIDVRGKSKGRGFQGGVKRFGWQGQPKTHGSTTHRRIGSAGATTFPGRIIKGHRMPGHMGNFHCTIKNLKILKIDKEKNLLYIKGAIPGAINSKVFIKRVGPK